MDYKILSSQPQPLVNVWTWQLFDHLAQMDGISDQVEAAIAEASDVWCNAALTVSETIARAENLKLMRVVFGGPLAPSSELAFNAMTQEYVDAVQTLLSSYSLAHLRQLRRVVLRSGSGAELTTPSLIRSEG